MKDFLLYLENLLARTGIGLWLERHGAWLAIAAGIGLVALLLVRILRRPRAAKEIAPEPQPSERHTSGGIFGSWTHALAAQIPESEKERREFGAVLRQAGLYSPTARASVYAYRFLFLVFPLICAGLIALAAPREQTWKILGVGGIIAAVLSIIPRLFVWSRRRHRLAEMHSGLADMLDMLSMCLGGGMSISHSLDHVAKNLTTYPALSEELQIMRRQAEVGSLRIALRDWASRVDTHEIRQVATLLARGDALGTALSGSLLDQADHFRTARKQLATLQANRMPVFLTFPLLFCFAPAVLIILMSPALLQVSEFLNPQNANNPLANNSTISTQNITQQLTSLNQDISPAAAPRQP